MSWLDFANHFLSNQRLHAWSWINRTSSWEWFFFVGNLALSVFGLFFFYFCLVWGEQVTDAQDFGWQSKGEDHFRSWFPFFSCFLGDKSALFRHRLVRRPFCIFLLFSSDPWSGIFLPFSFLFCFLSIFDWEFSLFFLFFFWGQGLWWIGALTQGL